MRQAATAAIHHAACHAAAGHPHLLCVPMHLIALHCSLPPVTVLCTAASDKVVYQAILLGEGLLAASDKVVYQAILLGEGLLADVQVTNPSSSSAVVPNA